VIDGRFDVAGAAGPTHFFEQLTAETLSHGYLFAGPAGVGKKTFALRLAQSLLCVTPKSTLLGYCGTCTGCTRVEGGSHPDLYLSVGQVKIGERDGSGFHAAEEATARDLVRQLSLHAYAGGWRIFVLGDVDFTPPAANALLKFFEEPPARVLLLLTTTAVARLLPTIRSRLLEVTFPLLAEREIVAILEREGITPDVAAPAAAIPAGARGRPGHGQIPDPRLARAPRGRTRRAAARARSGGAAGASPGPRPGRARAGPRSARRCRADRPHQRQPGARRRPREDGAVFYQRGGVNDTSA
jgi:DNA polymerase-3 subunit delta'